MSFAWQKAVGQKRAKFTPFIYGVDSVKDLTMKERLRFAVTERKQINREEKSQFYQLFSVLIGAGVSTLASLDILADKTENERFYRVLLSMRHAVERGQSLSDAMGKFARVFSEAEVGIVKAGEAVGSLEMSFLRLAEQEERQAKVRQEIKSALLYPIIVSCVLVLAGFVMVTFVIPQMKELYLDNNIEITGLTALFIGASDIVSRYWLAIIGLLGTIIVAAQIYLGSRNGRLRSDYWLLQLPYFGEIIRKYNTATFTNSLGVLVESGIPIQDSLNLTQRALTNELYRLKVSELRDRVKTGEKISDVLEESPLLFSSNVTQIIAIGESSANVGDLALRLAKQYDEEISYKLKNLNTVIGPIVILIVAAFVVMFALAVLLPIFNLTQSVA